MRNLNVNEFEQVNGGWFTNFAVSWALGNALDWGFRQNWGSSRNNWDTNIAP